MTKNSKTTSPSSTKKNSTRKTRSSTTTSVVDGDDDVVDLLDDELEVSPEVPVAVITDDTEAEATDEDDDEGVVDLDEELHPDDVEEPLDVLLQERTASATLEDDEEELEEEEIDGDDGRRSDAYRAPTRRRVPLPVVLPRPPAPPPRRRGAAVLRRLRLNLRARGMTPPARLSRTRLGAALGAGVLTGLCFPPFDLGPLRAGRARPAAAGRGAARARATPRSTASRSASAATAW